MADPDFTHFNTYLPYRDDLDALQRPGSLAIGLVSFPESANPNQSESTDHRLRDSDVNFSDEKDYSKCG